MRVNKDGKEYQVPCSLSAPDAIEMMIHDMPNLEMLLPIDICYKDYILSLKKVNVKRVWKNKEFTREYGKEG